MLVQRTTRVLAVISLPFAGIVQSFAYSNIEPSAQYSWTENVGWMNWREANGASDGVRVGDFILMGYVWGENIGWMSVGDGVPANPPFYSNFDADDFGVNIAANGLLTGYAWGENVGWVNFSGGALATPANPARINCDGRLQGFAWSENLGWLNLSLTEPGHFVAVQSTFAPIACDVNHDGAVDGQDIQTMVNAVLTGHTNWRDVCSGDLFPSPVGNGLLMIEDIPHFVECLLTP